MVRFQLRTALIRRYEKRWRERAESAITCWMLDIEDPFEDAADAHIEDCLNEIKRSKYLYQDPSVWTKRNEVHQFLIEMGVITSS
jgi:hypothetical protein